MRIVAGRFKGRILVAPSGMATRPTSDRLRETVFNVLAHAYGDPVNHARVLDLFAGSGALGLEALSRGAVFAQFVEEAPAARGAIKDNIDALGVAGITKVYRRDATRLGPLPPDDAFTLVFCDPPYGKGLAEKSLASAVDGGWLVPNALIIIEESVEASVQLPAGLKEMETRFYGDTKIIFATTI